MEQEKKFFPVVEIVKSTYQPSKAEQEEEFDLPKMTLDEAAERLLRQVEIRHTDKPK